MATHQKPTKRPRHGKEPAPYASKILQLRTEARLTQLQLAEELEVRRGAVARWESGAREPRDRTYLSLAAMASDRHLQSLEDFFLSRMDRRNAEQKRRDAENHALRELARVRSEAAGTGEWAERARHLLKLSEMDSIELAKVQAQRISEARRSLSNGAFEAALFDIVEETHSAKTLQLGRRLEVVAALTRLDRQVEQLQNADSLIAENEKVLREKIETILVESETAIQGGKAQSEVWAILKKITSAQRQSVRRLKGPERLISRWLKLQAILKKYDDAKRDGKVADDIAAVKELERLLKGGKDAKLDDKQTEE